MYNYMIGQLCTSYIKVSYVDSLFNTLTLTQTHSHSNIPPPSAFYQLAHIQRYTGRVFLEQLYNFSSCTYTSAMVVRGGGGGNLVDCKGTKSYRALVQLL
jgi:hypothetical protein